MERGEACTLAAAERFPVPGGAWPCSSRSALLRRLLGRSMACSSRSFGVLPAPPPCPRGIFGGGGAAGGSPRHGQVSVRSRSQLT